MASSSTYRGYDQVSSRPLPEYRAEGVLLRHSGTGCEVLHLASSDTENLFSFCFTTPPRDNTGISHIIEHSVLSGSRRFRVKEPFSVLMKGSLHTFLNALTYPDRTVYPASSCNRADFFNLMTVYGDAVFHPLLRRETFMQEAWRVEEAEAPAGAGPGAEPPLRFAGVVYNEMKGAYSSPDSVVSEWISRSLLPDTPYAHDSGGDPAAIPSLTLEAAREFHARYYHPSNCRIFLYGDIPLGDILRFLDEEFLSSFTRGDSFARVPLQESWTSPRRLAKTFPVKADTPLGGRTSVTLSWLLPPVTDAVEIVTHEVLSEILVESAGSPLRKALVDSGLGEDLSPASGLETDVKQMIFTVGLRGTEPDREPKIQALVQDQLSAVVRKGLDPALVQSMMNRVEFRHREIKGSGSPYALRLMGRAFRGWVHGADPFDSLEFARPMAELKKRIAANPRHLESCLEKGLVANPHRLTLVVTPDQGQEARDAAAESARLVEMTDRLGAAGTLKARKESREFKQYQLAPDPAEEVARIPSLGRSDIPPEVDRIPSEEGRTPGGVPLTRHDLFTNEIVYLDLVFPTAGLPGELSRFLPLFGRAVTGMGLPGRSYDAVALDLFRLTGGFSSSLDAGGIAGKPDEFAQFMFFRTKCLRADLSEAVRLVGGLLSAADFRDAGRLRDILLELRNDMKSALIPGGHQFAMLRAAARLSEPVAREEEWRGITQLLFLESLAGNLDAELPRVVEALGKIRSLLLVRSLLIANVTAGREAWAEVATAVDDLASGLPAGPGTAPRRPPATKPADGSSARRAESLVASATVGYVAQAMPGFRFEHPLSGTAAVLGHLLSTGYLWEKVRMEGGAYGAFSYPRNMDGLFLMGSYRDPNIVSTLQAFTDGLRFMESGPLDAVDVDKAVIGTIGREDRPMDPGEKGFVSLQRRLHGITDDARQARRTSLLAVQRSGIAEAARELLQSAGRSCTAVIANRRSLEEAARQVPDLGGTMTDLPE
ncbi:MAG TPA: insulinase family protein [Spirochaetia bacterium]|nr:insulinase family protein [Spirochaetia bacterium]